MKFLITVLLFSTIVAVNDQWSDRLSSKINKAIENTFDSSDFSLEHIIFDEQDKKDANVDLDYNLFKIKQSGKGIGFAYVGQAPSMKNVFDYVVIFNPNFEIINTKVLIYRENHGKQIASKRWLSQFFGMDPSSRPKLREDIDGITGATISVNGMTSAMYDLLECIDKLKDDKKLI